MRRFSLLPGRLYPTRLLLTAHFLSQSPVVFACE
jgi:hypothetical protein